MSRLEQLERHRRSAEPDECAEGATRTCSKQESPESVAQPSVESNEVVQQLMDQVIKYTGTAAQNIFLMNALGIKPGWAKGARWSDGTKVDDFSIVDWIKYGMGESAGISRVATMQNRKKIYATQYRLKTE